MKSRFLKSAVALAFALATFVSAPVHKAKAAATSQTTHAFLCSPEVSVGTPGPRRVVNTASTSSPQPSYNLNNQGCALIAAADVGFFLSQGFTQGASLFTGQATALSGGASGTASVNTGITLPAYGVIVGVVLCETAGNAVTGGLNIGDAGSGTRFASAVALAANACVTIADSALTRLYVPSGVPTADVILLAAATSWNSASVNVTVLYSYF